MALVAYSDDSDLGSDSEDGDEIEVKADLPITGSVKTLAKEARDGEATVLTKVSPPPRTVEGVDSIEDEEEYEPRNEHQSSSLFSSVPAAIPVSSLLRTEEFEEDEVVDVPTVETWKVTQELKKQNNNVVKTEEKDVKEGSRPKKKVKIFVPSLSEFADDEEEEEMKEPPRKRATPSSCGSGLFSVLPEPKHVPKKEAGRSLVPHVLTKQPPKPQKPKKKVPKAATPNAAGHVSDEEEEEPSTGMSDFFSLSESPAAIRPSTSVSASQVMTGNVAPTVVVKDKVSEGPRVPYIQHEERPIVFEQLYQEAEEEGPSTMMPDSTQLSVPAAASGGIDEATLLRLTGKRGRKEAINFIDVNADDALLTRQEWMTKALSEEKPQHGFSKKREGLPTQKQKQKHQITYLAHQAKERELDLKNTWAQNKMTKMQSQAKYGF